MPAATTPASEVAPRTVRAGVAPEHATWVEAEGPIGRALVYPPREESESARPVTVFLHGLCGDPQNACAPFVDVTTTRGWLVCPRGEDVVAGCTRWRLQGGDDAQLVEASVRAAAREHAGEVNLSAPRVLVGFSLGGIAAVRIAQASMGTYEGLVVIASQVHPDASLLKRAGVKRVVLAAAELDLTSAPLRKDAVILASQGIPTRFVDLGQFGHGYPPDIADRMREAMQWVAGDADHGG
jgi:predicted esterase